MIQPPFLFKIAGLPLFSYTLLITAGLAAALLTARPGLRRTGLAFRDGVEASAWMTAPALVCGRIAHVLYNVSYFVERPVQMWWFADGGLALVGVAIGGAAGLYLWSRRRGQPFVRMLDTAAVPIGVLATAAWFGALFHGSQYGAPADGLFAMELRDEFGVIVPRWPTPLLAAGWSALSALAVMATSMHSERAGRESGLFLLVYSSGLFVLDGTRGDLSVYILGLRLTQCLYLVAFLCGVAILGRRYGRA